LVALTGQQATDYGLRGAGASGSRHQEIDGGVAFERPLEIRDLRRFSHEAMATVFELYVVHRDERYAAQAARAAFDLIDRLELELSRFLPNSDITRVNHLSAGEETRVTASTLECLVIARHMFDLTGGAFDISIGSGLPSLEIDEDDFLVRATSDAVHVDLGGIGKGYAVDLVGELLEEWGLEQALVHGGFSSVLALESPSGLDGWPLTMSDPAAPSRVLNRLSMRQTALGASGVRKKDHIVDPHSGTPVHGRLASWAAVPRPQLENEGATTESGHRVAAAAVADAVTTAFMMLGADAIEDLCERSPGLEAWILPEPESAAVGPPALVHFGASAV
jgi:FAD:protein FMN transferase